MIRALFKHEFRILIRSKKNILFLIFLAIALLSYCFIILPNKQTADSFDSEKVRYELEELEITQKDRDEKGLTGYQSMSGRSVYSDQNNYFAIHKAMLQAFEDQNFERYARLYLQYLTENWWDYAGNPEQYQQSDFPGKDKMHDYNQTLLRYKGYFDENIPISYPLIEQKTALQSLESFFLSSSIYILVFMAIYFSSDMVVRDRQYRTLLQGIPMGWYRILNIKTMVVFFYTMLVIVLFLGIGIGIISITNGFGYTNIHVPYMTFKEWNFTLVDYDIMSLGKYLLYTLSFIPILIYLFIRLNVLLSLLFKNQWLVLLISTAFLLSERVYFSRRTRDLFGIEISNFPQTYFDFGRIITNGKNYLVNLDTITYSKGITVLCLSILVLEVLLLIVSRIVTKQRFY
ncbi:ABC transporter permease subunit [Ornithinibacillus scapharcae]|uniref:ABC transporter permease subunit n=1 Tax=Ornithinibacillus scapharcae TaxID=1147159 RepID=UPI000225B6B2|nr:ABC transporter permease subunit [Ornithinibacillus scapharcae]